MELCLRKVSGRTEVRPDPSKVQIRLYSQPEGRAFVADFRPRGRRRSLDRLTSTQTKIHQQLRRARRKDLRRTFLDTLGVSPSVVHWLYWMELCLWKVSGRTEVRPKPSKVQIRLYGQPEGRTFISYFRQR